MQYNKIISESNWVYINKDKQTNEWMNEIKTIKTKIQSLTSMECQNRKQNTHTHTIVWYCYNSDLGIEKKILHMYNDSIFIHSSNCENKVKFFFLSVNVYV